MTRIFRSSLRSRLLLLVLLALLPVYFWRSFVHEKQLGWSWRDELRAYQIIRSQDLVGYNVTAFYQGIATPQRYLHRRDEVLLPDDYYHNEYLFVLYPDESWTNDSAYEMNSFVPYLKLNEWQINERYNLYLLRRGQVSSERS